MSINPLLILTIFALVVGALAPKRWRTWLLFVGSLVSLFALQPSLSIRNLDFWLPILSILLVVLVWTSTNQQSTGSPKLTKSFIPAILVILGLILLIALSRYVNPLCCLTPTRPPQFSRVTIFIILGGGLAVAPLLLKRGRRQLSLVLIILIIGIFIILKTPDLAAEASGWLRRMNGQPAEFSNPQDIAWLGFSFLAFRLLHVLFDYRSGKLSLSSLQEFITYALFFSTVPAGPIDRLPRFVGDLRQETDSRTSNITQGSWRILLGLFKKFVLADTLALIALNSQNARQVIAPAWLWLLLYAYALRIYFDFSGYTDVAIGLGRMVGLRLPENFNRPYLRVNLTAFWNSWHITLAQWFRSYYFNPLTRSLRTRRKKLPNWLIILVGQFTTMMLIGLWHGITWNFAIWGAWHGLGLFIHNRWTEWLRPRQEWLQSHSRWHHAIQFGGWFLTFNYVALGWVWFAIPSPTLSWTIFQQLFGM